MSPCIGGTPPCTGYSDGSYPYSPLIEDPNMPNIQVISGQGMAGNLYINWTGEISTYEGLPVSGHFIVRRKSDLVLISGMSNISVDQPRPAPVASGLVDLIEYWLYYCLKTSVKRSVWKGWGLVFIDGPAPPPPLTYIVDGADYIVDGTDFVID